MNRALKIGILEGDDIGLEVVPETVKVMKAAAHKTGLQIEWFPMPIGKTALDKIGYTLPPGTLEKLFTLDGWVLGPIGHQAYPKDNPHAINPHPILRKNYDCSRTYVRRNRCRACRRCILTSISSSCARTTKAFRRTATCSKDRGNSVRRPT